MTMETVTKEKVLTIQTTKGELRYYRDWENYEKEVLYQASLSTDAFEE